MLKKQENFSEILDFLSFLWYNIDMSNNYDRETKSKHLKRLFSLVLTIVSSVLLVAIVFQAINKPAHGEAENSKLYRVTSVVDGDTIKIDYSGIETSLRLIGINAPEINNSYTMVQCYGTESAKYLTGLLSGKSVKIEVDPTQDSVDDYNRLLRYVYLEGEDIGLKMVSGGYAREYTYNNPYNKQSEYKNAEASAKQNKNGQWADSVCANTSKKTEQPKAQPVPVVTPTQTAKQQCNIKGNINKKGQKIYHMPGQQYYNDTVIKESDGERWFCTEQEAINAGWRKSKV